jgi:hypothetical protein
MSADEDELVDVADVSDIDTRTQLPEDHPLYVEGIDDKEDSYTRQEKITLAVLALLVVIGVLIALVIGFMNGLEVIDPYLEFV